MAPPPPELIEELVEEVLLRFPADDPASLVRAALVCKLWCRLVSGTAFRRRFREFHRGAAPLLGVLYNTWVVRGVKDDDDDDEEDDDDKREPTAAYLVPTTSYRPADVRRDGWRAIDAHHGRVLLRRAVADEQRDHSFLSVWDPVTDEQRDLPETPLDTLGYSAAVACAAAGGNCCCDHLDCPFLVVAIAVEYDIVIFSVYSSEAGAWSNPTFLHHPNPGGPIGAMKHTPGVLVGTALYFLVRFSNEVVEYDLATQQLSIIDLPSKFCPPHPAVLEPSIVLMTGDDGQLGFAVANTKYQLELWSMVVAGGDADFVPRRVIDLHKVLPSDTLINSSSLQVNGFADGGDSRFLFMRTSDELYSIELNSSHVSKVATWCGDDKDHVVPCINFCTPTSKYNFASTRDDAASDQAPASYLAGASPDARLTTATAEDDGLQKIVLKRRRTQNPRFYGPEWANM